MLSTLYLVVTGAGTARRVPDLLQQLLALRRDVIVLLTPNSQRILSPRELALIPGHRVVESYLDDAILPTPPLGLVLIAPCDFNSLNKLALGIADNLPLSVAAEAIGRRTPVVVGVSCNKALWGHPRAQESVNTLRSWGCVVVDPVTDGDRMTMASTSSLTEAVRHALVAYESEPSDQLPDDRQRQD